MSCATRVILCGASAAGSFVVDAGHPAGDIAQKLVADGAQGIAELLQGLVLFENMEPGQEAALLGLVQAGILGGEGGLDKAYTFIKTVYEADGTTIDLTKSIFIDWGWIVCG